MEAPASATEPPLPPFGTIPAEPQLGSDLEAERERAIADVAALEPESPSYQADMAALDANLAAETHDVEPVDDVEMFDSDLEIIGEPEALTPIPSSETFSGRFRQSSLPPPPPPEARRSSLPPPVPQRIEVPQPPIENRADTLAPPHVPSLPPEDATEAIPELEPAEATGELDPVDGTGDFDAVDGTGELDPVDATGELPALDASGAPVPKSGKKKKKSKKKRK